MTETTADTNAKNNLLKPSDTKQTLQQKETINTTIENTTKQTNPASFSLTLPVNVKHMRKLIQIALNALIVVISK